MSEEGTYTISMLRRELLDARRRMLKALQAYCGPDHKAIQRRDKRPPWCPHCGYSDDGERLKYMENQA